MPGVLLALPIDGVSRVGELRQRYAARGLGVLRGAELRWGRDRGENGRRRGCLLLDAVPRALPLLAL